jgi:DNA repair protein RadC
MSGSNNYRKEKEMTQRYAYKITTVREKASDFPYKGEFLNGTEAAISFLTALERKDIENFVAIYLDIKNKVIGLYQIEGTVSQCPIHPREVVRRALLVGAGALILAHNHPSGNPEPSAEDMKVTSSIQKAARMFDMELYDHIIIGEAGKFHSMRETGTLPKGGDQRWDC